MTTNSFGFVSYTNPASSNFPKINEKHISPQTKIIYETSSNADKKQEKGTSDTMKALVAMGTLVTAGLGIYTVIKGKGKGFKNLSNIKSTPVLNEELERLSQSSVLSIKDFKKVGIFEKGKALINGKGYTGTIEICKEKGTKQIYENGVLKEAFRKGERRLYESNGKIKVFNCSDGKLKKIFYRDSNGAKIIYRLPESGYKKVVLKPDGSAAEYFYLNNRPTNEEHLQKMIERKSKNPIGWHPSAGVKIDKKTGRKITTMVGIGEIKPHKEEGYYIKAKRKIGGRTVHEFFDPKTRKLELRETPLSYVSTTENFGNVLSCIEDKTGKSICLISTIDGKTLAIDSNSETIKRCLSGDKKFITQKISELEKINEKN